MISSEDDKSFWVIHTQCDTPALGYAMLFQHMSTALQKSQTPRVESLQMSESEKAPRVLLAGPRTSMEPGGQDGVGLREFLLQHFNIEPWSNDSLWPHMLLTRNDHIPQQSEYNNRVPLHALWQKPLANPPLQLFITPPGNIAPF